MSFLKSIFGRSPSTPKADNGIEAHLDYLKTLRTPAIALSEFHGDAFSQIGGLPSLPEGINWPDWNGAPLAFLCQLDLTEIPEDCVRNGLPTSGILYFFYDQKQETWGFDPGDKGSWRVLYTPALSQICTERSAPKGLSKDTIYGKKRSSSRPSRPIRIGRMIASAPWT